MRIPSVSFGLILGLLSISNVHGRPAPRQFSLNAASIGHSVGAVTLAGGGSYDIAIGHAKAGGPFRCLADIHQGPLTGCKSAEGLRWEVAELRPSATFKCSEGAAERTAVTDKRTVVILARFFRQTDGEPPFSATMIVSTRDLDPDLRGTQNVWIEGVGCGRAVVQF